MQRPAKLSDKKPARPRGLFAGLIFRDNGRLVATAVLAAVIVISALLPDRVFTPLRSTVFDTYQRLHPRQQETYPVVIVAIDDASLEEYGQWPWPRTQLADLVLNTFFSGALSIGLTMIMPEEDRLSPSRALSNYPGLPESLANELATLESTDSILAEALGSVPVALGRAAVNGDVSDDADTIPETAVTATDPALTGYLPAYSGRITNLELLESVAQGRGYLNAAPERDGIVRRIPLMFNISGTPAPSLSIEVLRLVINADELELNGTESGISSIRLGLDGDLLPTNKDGSLDLYFTPSDANRFVSARDVLAGAIPPDRFENQVVLIGATAVGVADRSATPLGQRMTAVEIQAQAIEQLLSGVRIHRPDWMIYAELAMLATGAWLLIAAMPLLPQFVGFGVALGFVVINGALGYGGFVYSGLLFDPILPSGGVVLVYATMLSSLLTQNVQRRKALQTELENERLQAARIAGELKAAREIQLGILPDTNSLRALPSAVDVGAILISAKEVGGDLFDAFALDDNRVYFVVGDVTGKGVPAALFMALSKAMCKSAALRLNGDVAALISEANTELSRENPAALFVTAFAGILHCDTGVIDYCNAGHEDPQILKANGDIVDIQSDGGLPLCVMEDFLYFQETMTLEPGDTLIIVTDGVTEARNRQDELFGRNRLNEAFARASSGGANGVVRNVVDTVRAFEDGGDPVDDVTVMAVRYIGKAQD
ncbi:MAG: CHASE2 domain-containing protein [Alphaproteobacteria bacterium]